MIAKPSSNLSRLTEREYFRGLRNLLALLLIRSSLFCSKSLILKSDRECSLSSLFNKFNHDHEQIALVALYKRVTVTKTLLVKEQRELFALKNNRFAPKYLYFSYVFNSFSLLYPFLCPRANCSRRSLLRYSFLKRDRRNSLLSLFTKK